MILLAAVFAYPINLKRMPGREVVIFPANFLLQMTYLLREEFDRTAAIGAYHVVMTAPVVLVLVTSDSIMECHFARQATLCQQFERAVDSRIADAGVFLLYQTMEFVRRKMVTGFQKGAQNRIALRGLLQPHAFQVAVQNLLGLANHLAGESGLIINALLQHAGKGSESGYHSSILKMKFIFTGDRLSSCGIQSNSRWALWQISAHRQRAARP